MTQLEAIIFLRTYAKRKHAVEMVTVGPSHGDPGGYTVPGNHCPHVKPTYPDGKLHWEGGHGLCTCGALAHNIKVDEALTSLADHYNQSTL
jgi:hypothetical protein